LVMVSDGRPTMSTNPCKAGDHGSGKDFQGNPKGQRNSKSNPDLVKAVKDSGFTMLMALAGDVTRADVECLTKPENIVVMDTFEDYTKFQLDGDFCIEKAQLTYMKNANACGGFVGDPRVAKIKEKLGSSFIAKADGPCDCNDFCTKKSGIYWTFTFDSMQTVQRPKPGEPNRGWQPYPCMCYTEKNAGDCDGVECIEIKKTNPGRKLRFGGPIADEYCAKKECVAAQY